MYKIHLILKYLLKRRIAWVSLLAVMLCTTMVLVVISVMGGWLNMFKQSFHGLTGDIIIKTDSLAGFPYYQEIIEKIDEVPNVEAAVPVIETFGLINVGNITTEGVQVMGFPIDKIGNVNRFPDSLHRQHEALVDELKDAKLQPEARARIERQLKEPPTFDLLDVVRVALETLPPDVRTTAPPEGQTRPEGQVIASPGLPASLAGRLRYDPLRNQLVFKNVMSETDRAALKKLSADNRFQAAIDSLYAASRTEPLVAYKAVLPDAKSDVTTWPGMIPGAGVVGIRREQDRATHAVRWVGRGPGLYELPVKLTVLGIPAEGGNIDLSAKAERNYWIVDDSRTQIWQYDNRMVYVPLDVLQKDLGMDEQQGEDRFTHQPVKIPARTTEISVRMKAGSDLQEAKKKIQAAVQSVLSQRQGFAGVSSNDPYVETWLESQAMWINAIENEKLLTTFLFGIISVVAIFLIFCIFYMIVKEKTKDIGIIKSVGATSSGVAGIFLGYGLVIGLAGASLGLLVSYLIISNINELHAELGYWMHVQIWNPEVYLFDKIPSTMDPTNAVVIPVIAVVASVVGALVPAMFAARMNPVESLRWE